MGSYFDQILFIALPYVSLFTFFLMTIYRYRAESFSYSSLSSQFLENKQHFWTVVPFHYGILIVMLGHFVAFCIPRSILVWNSHPLRLYILEITALSCGLLTLVGLVGIVWRRLTYSKVRGITSPTDWIIYAMLVLQVLSGVGMAIFHPWGSSWFASNMTPYLWSILTLDPEIHYVVAMPLLVKFHIVMAFLTVGFFPFTRLVHILVIPNPYLWRKNQIVRWNRSSKS